MAGGKPTTQAKMPYHKGKMKKGKVIFNVIAFLVVFYFIIGFAGAKTQVFFRDDDFGELTPEAVNLITLFESKRVPLSIEVIPDDLTEESILWLNQQKANYTSLLGIHQHGYSHELFQGVPYEEQLNRIQAGKAIMQTSFGSYFKLVFTAPYNKFDNNTLLALQESDFKIISASTREWFYGNITGYSVKEYSICINVLDSNNEIKPYSQLVENYEMCKKHTLYIGIMLHHEEMNESELLVLSRFISYVKRQNNTIMRKLEDFQ